MLAFQCQAQLIVRLTFHLYATCRMKHLFNATRCVSGCSLIKVDLNGLKNSFLRLLESYVNKFV